MNPLLMLSLVQVAFPLIADITELMHDKTLAERKATGIKLLTVAGTIAAGLVPGASGIVQEVEAAAPAIVGAVFSIIDAAKQLKAAAPVPATAQSTATAGDVATLPVAAFALDPLGHPVR